MLQSQQIKELRQSGKLQEALELATVDLEQNQDNIYAKRNISWVYWMFLKDHAEKSDIKNFILYLIKVKELNLPENETMLFDTISWKIGTFLFQLLKLQNIPFSEVFNIIDIAKNFHYSKPSDSYSFLLKAAHKALKTNRDKYISFINWWNLENLRPEDFEKEVLPNGRMIMSIAEQVYTAYYKALIPNQENQIEKNVVLANVQKIDDIVEEHSDYIYLIYFKAQMLLAIGEKEELKKSYLPFAQKKATEFWVWDLMSQIVDSEEEKLSCLCQACKSGRGVEQMKTGLYLRMANYFLSKNMLPEAKCELLKIKKIKEEYQQKVPAEVTNLLLSERLSSIVETISNNSFYNSKTSEVDTILFSNLPSQNIFVSHINHDKNIINFITADDKTSHFKHERINPKLKIFVGDVLNVRFSQFSVENISRLNTLKKGTDDSMKHKNLKSITGILKINPKGFGFLEDVYFPKTLIEKNNFKDGENIDFVAIRKYNKEKETLGWNFLKLQ
ncbi:DUF7017 domain-containing protein [Chryseobacterium balustinum]|uniref:Tetratricopeptide repeat protein n=1 Tax=Chryseobacterium balustinum TaxID=246 RepID=A0ABY1LBE8_9FLAO|nr:hypothetical protein [Chryseobacterium balustinum]AZB32136.1 hypothetical protein EB354_22920 [Chryseobacterium balustinum]SKB93881.1 hypothetical protein SAMN05421800_11546 [Chryseobacterium balustinum]